MNRLFGRQLSPEELVKKWRQEIRQQERELDRQLRGIQSEEAKVKKSLQQLQKQYSKAGDLEKQGYLNNMKGLAKELVRSKKAKERMHTSKAQLNSVVMQLQQQLSQVKVAGSLKKSSEIMKLMNKLVKLPEISKVMQEMSKEMMKTGIMEEMMNDTLDTVLDSEGLEEEADEEVDKIVTQLTQGILLEGGQVGTQLPEDMEPEEIPEENYEEVKSRLEALKS